MAEWLQSLVLALIQGVTEFLPVSSSAHLILPSRILGWPDQGILFDVGVHAGTLCAVVWYFRATLASWFASLLPGRDREGSELWPVVIATVPVVLAGWLLRDMIANEARGVPVIIATTLIFGVLLGFADRRAPDVAAGRSHIRCARCTAYWQRSGVGADSRHVAIRHHHHGSTLSGLPSRRRGTLSFCSACPSSRGHCW